jgi:iron complex outermembrane receptor protein
MLSAALSDRLFINGGLRVERSAGNTVTLPLAGWSLVPLSGPLTVRLRGAWGRGIRYPETPIRETLQGRIRAGAAAAGLEPEQQSGLEGGFDIVWARGLSLTVTRFDQRASGLIQSVMLPADTGSPGPGPRDRVRFQLQNVGAIDNSGWEVQGAVTRGALAVTGALSLVDSRVRRLASGYAGDLRAGDRMLEVPRRTMSISVSWSGSPWFASVTAWRAEDWINYDRIALTADFAADTSDGAAGNFTGLALRQYWRGYAGVTRLEAAFTWPLNPRLQLSLVGQNLLDKQTGEPDNITVLPGRTVSASVKATF